MVLAVADHWIDRTEEEKAEIQDGVWRSGEEAAGGDFNGGSAGVSCNLGLRSGAITRHQFLSVFELYSLKQEKMPKKYDKVWIDKICAMTKEGHSVGAIQKWLKSNDIHMSKQSVWYYAKGMQKIRCVTSPKTTPQVRDLIGALTRENDEFYGAAEIKKILKSEYSIEISESSIRRIRRELGWSFGPPRIHPTKRDINREERVAQARAWMESKEEFNNVIFSDETAVGLERFPRLASRMRSQPTAKPRQPLKVHVWAAISRAGPGPIMIFEGILDKQSFQEEVVVKVLAPYVKNQWPLGHRLFQDSGPKCSTSADFLLENGVNWVPTPLESPDFNPIKIVWDLMKNHIWKVAKPKTKEGLIEAIKDFWYKHLTKETCNDLIDNLNTVLPIVIERNGLLTETYAVNGLTD